MADYTPTTEEVREWWAEDQDRTHGQGDEAHMAEFDRWLAAHDAEKRAEWEAEHGAEVTDWEYGVTTKWGIHEHPHLEGAERYAAGVRDEIERGRASGDRKYHGRVMKRTTVKAGPWMPVEQEGESNA